MLPTLRAMPAKPLRLAGAPPSGDPASTEAAEAAVGTVSVRAGDAAPPEAPVPAAAPPPLPPPPADGKGVTTVGLALLLPPTAIRGVAVEPAVTEIGRAHV